MPVLPPQQQSNDWDSNIYVVIVTRILVVVGTTYLIRSVYQYITRLRVPNEGSPITSCFRLISNLNYNPEEGFADERCSSIATPVSDASLDLDSLALGDPNALALHIDFHETPNPPGPIYQPSQRPLRPQTHLHQHPRRHRPQRARSPLATTRCETVNIESGDGHQTAL